ncbi:MAG: carboxylesterase/lipase family protein [Myxococcota bacterium]
MMSRVVLLMALLLGLPLQSLEAAPPAQRAAGVTQNLVVQTTWGPVEGFQDVSTYRWLGIPFAAPPTDARRWLPPEDPTPWTNIRPAQDFAQPCAQLTTTGGLQGGEDCLYLNVWKPLTPSSMPRPIMVWIHGGGNEVGATSDYLYGGQHLAANNEVIVVSITYRLSSLGWFNHPALHAGEPLTDSGNFGLLDIMQALRWVRQNGAAFGGDPQNITAFGESAGGMNLWALLGSPMAAGLFDKAIILSGYPQDISVARAQGTAQGVLEALVIADGLATSQTVASFLASKDEAWIQQYLHDADTLSLLTAAADTTSTFTEFYAIQDGTVLPEDLLGAFAAGDYHHMPLIVGSMRDEMKCFLFPLWLMNRVTYSKLMAQTYGDFTPEIEALYPRTAYQPASYYNAFTDMADHLLESFASIYMTSLVSQEVPVWVYNFQYDNLKGPFSYAIGAGHGLELPFVFSNFRDSFYPNGTEAERQTLAQTTQGYFACFAYTGDPSSCSPALRDWPRFEGSGVDKYQRMILDTTTRVETLSTRDIERANLWLDFHGWSQLPTLTY